MGTLSSSNIILIVFFFLFFVSFFVVGKLANRPLVVRRCVDQTHLQLRTDVLP